MVKEKTTAPLFVEKLSHDGRGIAHLEGKTIFINNALPGEEVTVTYLRHHRKFAEAKATTINKPAPERLIPKCPHFNSCGGCTLQQLSPTHQLAYKSKMLQEQLTHSGIKAPSKFLPPIMASSWNYRTRARLGVKYVEKKQKVLVGFHELNGRYITDATQCPILHTTLSNKISHVRELIAQLSIYQHIPQIEVACGDNMTILVLRNLQKFSSQDLELLQQFEKQHKLRLYAQPGDLTTIAPLFPPLKPSYLSYRLPKQNMELFFTPIDFTQINQEINQQLVTRVLELLMPKANEQLLDLFCGIGNFTLPLSRKCAKIVGVEGSCAALTRASYNANHNKCHNVEFYSADLSKELPQAPWNMTPYDKIFLDPPRTGAAQICSQIKQFGAQKIGYVSCNHQTLLRDIKILIANGYQLTSIGIADMFPHTKHMETIALFTRVKPKKQDRE